MTATAHASDLKFPPSQTEPPKGYSLTAKKVIRIAAGELRERSGNALLVQFSDFAP